LDLEKKILFLMLGLYTRIDICFVNGHCDFHDKKTANAFGTLSELCFIDNQ